MRPKVRRVYGEDGGYDEIFDGHEISLDCLHGGENSIYQAVEFLRRRAKPQHIAGLIARMRVSLIRRAEDNADAEILMDTLMDICSPYPYDIVKATTDKWLKTKKFFPIPSEFKAELDELFAFREGIFQAFELHRNPILARERAARKISADPRFGVHFKALPRKEWMKQHYDWWVEEAEGMVNLARQNPALMNPAVWEAEVNRRNAERIAALAVPGNLSEQLATPPAENLEMPV
jgi:hypothetical protein